MHLIQQGGEALHFVYHDPIALRPCLDLLAERFGLAGQRKECLRAEEIEPQRIWKDVSQPRCLAGPARTEQEERMVWQTK
jgi:hypothetical protein